MGIGSETKLFLNVRRNIHVRNYSRWFQEEIRLSLQNERATR